MTDIRLKYAAGTLPRYTSYPTANHFADGMDEDTYRSWLQGLPENASLSLYLHVPFCRSMCWYCGCHTKVTRKDAPLIDYAKALEQEIERVAAHVPPSARVHQVHWGGGTPTILALGLLERLTEQLDRRFSFGAHTEHAIEVDPRTASPALAATLAAMGVNRVSFGVQDFDPTVQAAINRVQCYSLVARVVEGVREAGISGVNFDLIYGLPHQTVASLERTVDQAVQLRPDRIALFGYAHVPWMKTHQRLIPEEALAGPEERLAQAEAASERLESHGYQRVGLDHFALPHDPMAIAAREGTLRRNFQGYTTDAADGLIGFGASAIGSLPEGYVQNARDIGGYARALNEGRLPVSRGLRLSADDRARRLVIEQMMCQLEADPSRLPMDFGGSREAMMAEMERFAPMVADGLARMEGSRVVLEDRARPVMRWAAARFDRYLEPSEGRHSAAV